MSAIQKIEEIPALTADNWLGELTGQEQRFVLAYLKNYDVDEACEASGFAASMGHAKVYSWVCDSLSPRCTKPHVARAIEFGRRMLNEQMMVDTYTALRETKAIATSDIRKVVRWEGSHVDERDNDEGGDVLVIKRTVNNTLELIPSDQISDETARAIAEVSQDANGNIKVKMHPKVPALTLMSKMLGMSQGKLDVNVRHSGLVGVINVDMTPKEAAEAWAGMLDEDK